MKPHLLVVDDEASIRELLSIYLQTRGYQISSAGSADEALRLAGELSLDLVLLDLLLPDADGLELLVSLKTAHPDLPVIIMTGMGFDQMLLKEAKEKGASGYISKTLPLDKLVAEIENNIGLR